MGRRLRTAAATALALAAACLLPAGAAADNIPVTTTADVSADDDVCSLREAIQAATANAPVGPGGAGADCPAGASGNDDFVQLQAGTYSMAGAANENANASGDFDLDFSSDPGYLVIDGVLGAGEVPATIIDAADQDRIFDVLTDVGSTSALEIREVTLRNGKPPEANSHGGAILIRDPETQFDLTTARIENSDALGWGGGLANLNGVLGIDLDITQVEFSGNDAGDDGGAIWADGPQDLGAIDIRRSALIGNHSDQMGGGIYIKSDGDTGAEPVVQLVNSTLSGNTADVAGGGVAFAFGLGGTLFTRFSTIANNSTPAAGQGGGIDTTPGIDEFILSTGTILAGNTAAGAPANCDDPTEFSGDSIESGPVACFPGATVADPLLAPLTYNATGDQTTRTHGLFDGSPAINALGAANCDNASDAQGTDQRGVARPAGGACDAGAFEGSAGPAPSTPAGPGSPAAPAKKCKKKKKKAKKRAGTAKKKKKKCKKKKKKRK